MAKNVVFNSEKIERREQFRKLLPAILAAVGVLIVILAAAFGIGLVRGNEQTGGEGTPYPYSWRVKGDGTVVIELDRSAKPELQWIFIPVSDGSGEAPEGVEVSYEPVFSAESDDSAGGDASRFLVTPLRSGSETLTFRLSGADWGENAEYEIRFLASSEETGKGLHCSILDHSGEQLAGKTSGSEYGYEYVIDVSDSSEVYVMLTDTGWVPEGAIVDGSETYTSAVEVAGSTDGESSGETEESAEVTEEETPEMWKCVSYDTEILSVSEKEEKDGKVYASLTRGKKTGSCSVELYNSEKDMSFKFIFVAEADGFLRVEDQEINAP